MEIALIAIGALILLGKKGSSTPSNAATATAPNGQLTALQKAVASLQQQAAKSAAASKSASGGGAPTSGGPLSAQQAGAIAASQGNFTPIATIDQLATDGNAQDGQVAAYLAATNNGDTTLANAIIGNDAQATLDQSSPSNDLIPLTVLADPTYTPPAVTYDPGTGGSSGDGSVFDGTAPNPYGYLGVDGYDSTATDNAFDYSTGNGDFSGD